MLTPGATRGEMDDAFHGDLGTILEWAGGGAGKRATDIPQNGMSVSLVAGARNHRNLPIDVVALFCQDIIQPFDAAA